MNHDEKKRRLRLAEQVATFNPTLAYWIACDADATRNEARAALDSIAFHLMESEGRQQRDQCVCGGDTITGSPWTDCAPRARASR